MHAPTANHAPLAESPQSAEAAYSFSLDKLQVVVPEIAEKREAIDASAQALISTFDIQKDFFDDMGRSMVFAAIAERASHITDESQTEERTFLHDVAALAAYKHSPVLAEAKPIMESKRSPLSEVGQLSVYDKYTSKELTVALSEKITNSGLLDETKKRLGISSDNEDPYEIRVLNIMSHDNEAYGMPMGVEYGVLPEDDMERRAVMKSEDNYVEARKDYKKGLLSNGRNMASEMGLEDLFGHAWITELDGKTFLCVSAPIAEKLIDPSVMSGSDEDNERILSLELANVQHEYTHTQGGLNVDKELTFGIGLEERRAELFSGDKHGYMDIKMFFRDYHIATGQDLKDVMGSLEKGGTQEEVYSAIANKVGLNLMLEVLLAIPPNYLDEQSNDFIRNAYEHLGGLDGITSHLIENEISHGRGDGLEERLVKRAQLMAGIIKDGDEWVWNNSRKVGLNTMTDLVNAKAEELGLKPKAAKLVK